MIKGNSSIVIPCSTTLDFCKRWFAFMAPVEPISQLGRKPLELLTYLLCKRCEIAKAVNDESLIPKLLFSTDVRDALVESCNISVPGYYNNIALYKKLNIIVDNDLDKRIVPDVVDNKFSLFIMFKINE